jgi:hypothetical protein
MNQRKDIVPTTVSTHQGETFVRFVRGKETRTKWCEFCPQVIPCLEWSPLRIIIMDIDYVYAYILDMYILLGLSATQANLLLRKQLTVLWGGAFHQQLSLTRESRLFLPSSLLTAESVKTTPWTQDRMSDPDSSSSSDGEPPHFTQVATDRSGLPPAFIPEDLTVENGMIQCRPGLSSMISELSLGVDAADLAEKDEEEELKPKKGMDQRGGLLGLLPLEEELSLSDESDNSDDDSDESGGGKNKAAQDKGPKVKGKAVMQVTDQIANDHYGDSGLYTGSVTVEALVPHGKGILLYENYRIYDGCWEDGKW